MMNNVKYEKEWKLGDEMGELKENNKLDENDAETEVKEKMVRRSPSKIYRSRLEAEKNRRKGDRIYRKPGEGYYIRRPQTREKSLLEKLFG